MRVLVSGSTGLVGSELVTSLERQRHAVTRLVRRDPGRNGAEAVKWDPEAGTIDHAPLEGLDAVLHLAGENIASGRWTRQKKARIRDSRVNGTRLLSQTLARLSRPPKAFLCASATGFYGDRGDEVLTEDSRAGTNFLAGVCQEWEAATQPAEEAGIRVIHLRLGVVFSPAGGALEKMALPFRLGIGGVVGSGRQYLSWITIEDVVRAVNHVLAAESLEGAVNAVAPQPVTNLELTKALGRVLKRPTLFPLPAFVARLALGEMADELLLASARVQPNRLIESGFEFQHPELESALRLLLRK